MRAPVRMTAMKRLLSLSTLLLAPLAFAQPGNSLEGDWTLLISGNYGKLQELAPAPTLRIQGKQLSGFSGCNRYSGTFSAKGTQFKVNPLASTKMACEPRPSKTEQAYFKAMQGVMRYQVSNNTLVLYTKGSGMLVFTRNPKIEAKTLNTAPEAAITSAAPDTQILLVGPKKVDCTGMVPMKCLQVRTPEQTNWEFFYQSIEGFAYEEGYTYKLRVRVEDVKNPPADASSKRYILVEVLEKNPPK